MNEITRVHLAKVPYNIEVSAYGVLKAYLEAIEKALHADMDAMREIELRMTELLNERGVNGDSVITAADVEALQKQLGDPKDFAGDDTTDVAAGTAPKKRLMRDTSNAMLGGVCSGIAAYFGWDVVLVRIAAVILAFITSGTMVLIYLILAVVMPKAKSASERLEMVGAPVTLGALKETAAKATETLEPILTKTLRLIFGVAFATGAVLAAIGVVGGVSYIISHINDFSFYGSDFRLGISVALATLSGVMFSVLCSLIAKMLFMRSAKKNLVLGAVIVAIIGAVSFTTATAITVLGINDVHTKMSTPNVTKQIVLTDELDGIKTVDVRSRSVNLHYDVSDSKKEASYAYSNFMMTKPDVKLTKMGDTLVVESDVSETGMCQSKFTACFNLAVDLYLTGPALDTLKTNALSANYAAIQQDSLSVEQKAATDLTITSVGSINTLQIKTMNGNLMAQDATLGTVDISGSRGTVNLSNIAMLTVAANTSSCSSPFVISASHIGTTKVNNQILTSSDTGPCLVINTTN